MALAGGIGMGEQDRRTWLNAAYRAIGHYPLHLLKRGAAEALRTADHPSKIIPAITAHVDPLLRQAQRVDSFVSGFATPALAAPGGERGTKAELDAICRQHGVGRYASADHGGDRRPGPSADPDRPCRAPTRGDYLRMGVAADVLDGMGIVEAPAPATSSVGGG